MIDTTSEISGLLQAGELARQQGQLAEARKLLGASLAEARRNGNQREEAAALLELARLSESGWDIPFGRQSALECLNLCEALDLKAEAGSALVRLGNLHAIQDQYEEALAAWSQALERFEQSGRQSNQLELLIGMGRAHIEQCDYAQAQARLERALELAEELGEHSALGRIRLYLGQITYFTQKDWPQAKSLFEQAAVLLEQYGPPGDAQTARHYVEALNRQLEFLAAGKTVTLASALAVSGGETMVLEAVGHDGRPMHQAFMIVMDENNVDVNISVIRPSDFAFSIRPAEARWEALPKNVFCLQHKSRPGFWRRLKYLFRPD